MFLAIALFLNTAQTPTTKKYSLTSTWMSRVSVSESCVYVCVCVQASFKPNFRNQLSAKMNRRLQHAGAHIRAYVCWWHLLFC